MLLMIAALYLMAKKNVSRLIFIFLTSTLFNNNYLIFLIFFLLQINIYQYLYYNIFKEERNIFLQRWKFLFLLSISLFHLFQIQMVLLVWRMECYWRIKCIIQRLQILNHKLIHFILQIPTICLQIGPLIFRILKPILDWFTMWSKNLPYHVCTNVLYKWEWMLNLKFVAFSSSSL